MVSCAAGRRVPETTQSVQTMVSEEPADMVNARFAILASIPLPDNPPDDTLKPIVLPPICTLHEFLGSTSGVRRTLRDLDIYSLHLRRFATCMSITEK